MHKINYKLHFWILKGRVFIVCASTNPNLIMKWWYRYNVECHIKSWETKISVDTDPSMLVSEIFLVHVWWQGSGDAGVWSPCLQRSLMSWCVTRYLTTSKLSHANEFYRWSENILYHENIFNCTCTCWYQFCVIW